MATVRAIYKLSVFTPSGVRILAFGKICNRKSAGGENSISRSVKWWKWLRDNKIGGRGGGQKRKAGKRKLERSISDFKIGDAGGTDRAATKKNARGRPEFKQRNTRNARKKTGLTAENTKSAKRVVELKAEMGTDHFRFQDLRWRDMSVTPWQGWKQKRKVRKWKAEMGAKARKKPENGGSPAGCFRLNNLKSAV